MASLHEQAHQQLIKQGLLPNKDKTSAKPAYKRANADRIVAALKLHAAGLTQQAIADELGCSQAAISLLLAKYGRSTAKDARQILEAKAADMALNVARNGRPADQLRALEGLSVIQPGGDKQQAGLSITINGFALVGLGLQGESAQPILDVQPLSPSLSPVQGQLSDERVIAKANIKPLISQADSGQYEAISGAGIAGDPIPGGKG